MKTSKSGRRWLQVFFLVLPSMVGWVACSSQWRDGQLKVDSRQVQVMAGEGIQALAQSGSDGDRFAELYNDPNSRVYFVFGGSGSGQGKPEAVAPIYNWQFMGNQLGTLTVASETYPGTQIDQIRVFLAERTLSGNSYEFALMVHVFTASGQDVRVFYSNGSAKIADGLMSATLTSTQGESLTVASRDVTGDDQMADFIQLDVYLGGTYVGKFATLMIP